VTARVVASTIALKDSATTSPNPKATCASIRRCHGIAERVLCRATSMAQGWSPQSCGGANRRTGSEEKVRRALFHEAQAYKICIGHSAFGLLLVRAMARNCTSLGACGGAAKAALNYWPTAWPARSMSAFSAGSSTSEKERPARNCRADSALDGGSSCAQRILALHDTDSFSKRQHDVDKTIRLQRRCESTWAPVAEQVDDGRGDSIDLDLRPSFDRAVRVGQRRALRRRFGGIQIGGRVGRQLDIEGNRHPDPANRSS